MAAWLFSYFIRADVLALRHQRRFRLLSWLIFVLAAALAVVAVQLNFLSSWNWLAGIEVVFLLTRLSILQVNRRWHLHD